MRKLRLLGKRGLSPIFATVLLAAIVIIFGTVAYYFASNITNTTTNNYASDVSNSQQSITERIGFENVAYNQSSESLRVYIINYGSANEVQINIVMVYDQSHNLVGAAHINSDISLFQPINQGKPAPTPIGKTLNSGKEAYFDVFNVKTSSGAPLTPGSMYNVDIVTKSGSSFDYEFTP